MEKFGKIFYYCCLGAFVSIVTYLAVMLFISPRQDALRRGFIPCTEQLVIDMSDCKRGEILCPLKFLWQDTKCNIGVVFNGFGAWVAGEQETPWANYLFEPKALAEIDEELPYPGSVAQDVAEMKNQLDVLQDSQAELEAAKNKYFELNEGVTMSDPGAEIPTEDKKAADKKAEITDQNSGDISEEWFEEIKEDEIAEQPNQEEKKDEE